MKNEEDICGAAETRTEWREFSGAVGSPHKAAGFSRNHGKRSIAVYCFCLYKSPVGDMRLLARDGGLCGAWFVGQWYDGAAYIAAAQEDPAHPVLRATAAWLDGYFSGAVPPPPSFLLTPVGETPFRAAVWRRLLAIPYGARVSYGGIAAQLAAERGLSRISARAVGGAVGHNPISILIPCHRVWGADGSLTGYAGGTDKKRFLCALEARVCGQSPLLS